jgi:thiamine phosphate synthase YjbQ (UPF0047 family)
LGGVVQDVRADMSDTLDKIVPEAGPNGEALYRHDAEGTLLLTWTLLGFQSRE